MNFTNFEPAKFHEQNMTVFLYVQEISNGEDYIPYGTKNVVPLDDHMKKYMDVLFISRNNDGTNYTILGGRQCRESDFPGDAGRIFQQY